MSKAGRAIVGGRFCFEEETQLTVHKNCVFFPGDGFIVYDPRGEIIFRFDSYGPDSHAKDELVLMDASGNCILTLLRKKPSLHQRWEGYLGEKTDGQEPIFSVYRSSIIGRSSVAVHVYGERGDEYQIEGSFSLRSCTIYNTCLDGPSKEAVAKIKRKVDPLNNVTLGKDVFLLCLRPGFDGAFAMGLVLVLDQMYGDDDDDENVQEADPTSENSAS